MHGYLSLGDLIYIFDKDTKLYNIPGVVKKRQSHGRSKYIEGDNAEYCLHNLIAIKKHEDHIPMIQVTIDENLMSCMVKKRSSTFYY